MHFVNVALDVPLYRLFSYSCEEIIEVGTRVLVDFTNKQMIGFVVENNVSITTLNFDIKVIKPVLKIFPEQLTFDTLRLIQFCADYYIYPLGQTIFNAIPNKWRKSQLIKLKIINKQRLSTDKDIEPVSLNAKQQEIVDTIKQNLSCYYPVLLYGITGSGKTEVYLSLIKQVLNRDEQALVLVPEINLTPQLLSRFKQRFPQSNIHVLTSNITPSQRLNGYIDAANGEAEIIIGTRLAVFTPFKNLGIIIVDEEHDTSFKQNDNLRYNARDLAVWRANDLKIPIVLGSATPSLETLYNYKIGKYTLLKLTNRAVSNAVMPEIKLIDVSLGNQRFALSTTVQLALKKRLEQKELSLVFINRRGYAPVINCYECGWVGKCKNCSANLVFHSKTNEVKCHYCGASSKIPKICPNCNSQHLQAIGQGTQKIEEELVKQFPMARIYRVDQDTLNSKKAWEELYLKINCHEIDIIVGTQILVKGHDFHNLTLVVGLNIDNGLYSYDFRASELLFTQLTQVAGRAGRGDKPGQVLLQTAYPQHELYQYLLKHDFSGFINYTLKQRKVLNLPPYIHYAMLRADSKELARALEFLFNVKNSIKPIELVTISQPVPAALYRLKNKERGQMLISSINRKELHFYLKNLVNIISNMKKISHISWQLDIDPLEM